MSVHVRAAGALADGRPLLAVEMSNSAMDVTLLNLGATLWQLVPKNHPDPAGVCLFHRDPAAYATNPAYLGCTVGPVANRIARSMFDLGGRSFPLDANEGANHLHGGPSGFGHRLWDVDPDPSSNSVIFRLHRPDGEGGYPGNLDVEARWTLLGDTIRFDWRATCDQATPVSLTNHTYWNLAGAGAGTGTITDHRLAVESDAIVEVDDDLLPTGALTPTSDTPFDLRQGPRPGEVIERLDGAGIDHCYVLAPNSRIVLRDPDGSLSLEVRTSLPGVQVYTGHQLRGSPEHGGYGPFAGICLETQFFPDAVNHPGFPSPVVAAGQAMAHWTTYTFEA